MRGTVMAFGLAALLLTTRPAGAEPVYMSDRDVEVRLNESTRMLDSQQTQADYWEYGWGAFDGGTMVWNAAQAGSERDRRARNTDIVQAAESFIGLADVVLRPLPAFDADEVCQDPVSQQDRQRCLEARETLLEQSAERAHESYELLPHLGNAGFNLAAGLIVWKVGGTGRALVTAIPGEIVGELQLWTTPAGPMADFDKYKVRFSPLLISTSHADSPATGLMASFKF